MPSRASCSDDRKDRRSLHPCIRSEDSEGSTRILEWEPRQMMSAAGPATKGREELAAHTPRLPSRPLSSSSVIECMFLAVQSRGIGYIRALAVPCWGSDRRETNGSYRTGMRGPSQKRHAQDCTRCVVFWRRT